MNLMSGANFIAVMIGLFAASQVFQEVEDSQLVKKITQKVKNEKLKWFEFKSLIVTILRSSGIGTFIGMIPGAGGDISSFLAYGEAKRFAKKGDKFGKGELKGVAAPEAANNATTGGAMIPLLTLGIPGDAVTAVMLGALMVQGIQPGPLLFEQHSGLVYTLFLGMLFANICIVLLGLPAIGWFVKVLKAPKMAIAAIIMMLCVVGSYALGNNLFDVWVMLIAGLIGYLMK